jgi:predicted aminopeptidase
MLVAWLLAIAVGAALGYTVAQRAARGYWQNRLEQEQSLLQAELDASKQLVLQLRQESAGLRYQIGEAEKARRYAEERLLSAGDASRGGAVGDAP